MKTKGAVACGHPFTAHAAEQILQEGGNAFDAIVAAHFAACVAEPVLASLGGSGYLLAHSNRGETQVYDFFSQTPQQKRPVNELDFYPINADFGPDSQEFHIGTGSIAVPGSIKGMFTVYRDYCSMPMTELLAPAIEGARAGVEVNAYQAYFLDIVSPIFTASEECRTVYGSKVHKGQPAIAGELLKLPDLANTLEALATEGEQLFYQGELAARLAKFCQEKGGLLTRKDLEDYQVIKRQPLEVNYRNATLLTNPPPSSGGILIGFALKLLEKLLKPEHCDNSVQYLQTLADVMHLTNKAKIDRHLDDASNQDTLQILDQQYLDKYIAQLTNRPMCSRGTTHISVMDTADNIASLTVSNGEGCGYLLPATGIMLNNVLGEEDINPHGFNQWPNNQRMTSMMAPSLLQLANGNWAVLGSGGSNRLRTAILQVIANLVDFNMPLRDAVDHPRIHKEGDHLSIENGLGDQQTDSLTEAHPDHKVWADKNVFFGGVHAILKSDQGFAAAGDPRRGGIGKLIN
jgi:gamma-glutamyltranspeptidase/glutathione hydrolase